MLRYLSADIICSEKQIINYPSNLLHNVRSFENWGIFSDIPQF